MPELPEIETICSSLRARLVGQRIIEAEVVEPRLRNSVSTDFPAQLRGRAITRVRRRGKYILVDLEGDRVWVSHLGMSGKLIYVSPERERGKHDHIIVRLQGGQELRYNDPRRFGLSLVLSADQAERWPGLKRLGPDPLDGGFNGNYLYGVARRSRRRIRDLLIDQSVAAGLGNIYANEILYHAGVRPTTRGGRLGRGSVEHIAEAVPRVLMEAIERRGTSFSDYRDGEDREGEFQNHLRVYDRAGERCVRCADKIKRVSLGNRSAFYCPTCQR